MRVACRYITDMIEHKTKPIAVDVITESLAKEAAKRGWGVLTSIVIDGATIDALIFAPSLGLAILTVLPGKFDISDPDDQGRQTWVDITSGPGVGIPSPLARYIYAEEIVAGRLSEIFGPDSRQAKLVWANLLVFPDMEKAPALFNIGVLDIVCASVPPMSGVREIDEIGVCIAHNLESPYLPDVPDLAASRLLYDALAPFGKELHPLPSGEPKVKSAPRPLFLSNPFEARAISFPQTDPNFIVFESLRPRLRPGVYAGVPTRMWRIQGDLTFDNEDIISPIGLAPLVAWWGEQAWRLIRPQQPITLAIQDDWSARLGCVMAGYRVTDEEAAVASFLAGVALIDRGGGDIDGLVDVFCRMIEGPKAPMASGAAGP